MQTLNDPSNSCGRPFVQQMSRATRKYALITRRPWSEIRTYDKLLTVYIFHNYGKLNENLEVRVLYLWINFDNVSET
jgi:hypothetical protein